MKRIFLLLLGMYLGCVAQAQEYKRIVSLATSLTQNLYLLEANQQLVGCTRFCQTQPEDSIVVVADAVSAYLEKIVVLQPDLVIASGLTPPKVLAAIERMGIKTRRFMPPRNFEEICQQFLELGKLSGKQERAEKIVSECRKILQELKKNRVEHSAPKVFMEIGCNPLYTTLSDSFMHEYITLSGGINIAQNLDKAVVSKEFVLLQNPDIIFIVGMGIVGEEEMVKWKAIKSLKATQNNKIYSLDSYICSPTPITFVETVKKITELIHPI